MWRSHGSGKSGAPRASCFLRCRRHETSLAALTPPLPHPILCLTPPLRHPLASDHRLLGDQLSVQVTPQGGRRPDLRPSTSALPLCLSTEQEQRGVASRSSGSQRPEPRECCSWRGREEGPAGAEGMPRSSFLSLVRQRSHP